MNRFLVLCIDIAAKVFFGLCVIYTTASFVRTQEISNPPSAGAAGAPTDATYVTQTANATLSAEQALSGLTTGIVKVTNGTGVLSTAVAGDFPTLNQNTSGTAAGLSATLAIASGGTGLTAIGDDAVRVGDGATSATARTLPSCSTAATSKLLYDTATNTFSCGTDQNTFTETILRLASDVSTGANTTPVNLTGLTFTATANTYYRVDLLTGTTAAAATTGFGVGVNCTNVPQQILMHGTAQLANAGTVTGWSSIANNAIAGATSGFPTANTTVPGQGNGFIRAHASTTGSCQFIFRSSASAVSTAKAGFTIVVRQIS